MRDEAFIGLGEDMVEHAVPKDALEGNLVGFGEGGEASDADGFGCGDGLRDFEVADVVEGEQTCVLTVSIVSLSSRAKTARFAMEESRSSGGKIN